MPQTVLEEIQDYTVGTESFFLVKYVVSNSGFFLEYFSNI